jgi:hypothetical protein
MLTIYRPINCHRTRVSAIMAMNKATAITILDDRPGRFLSRYKYIITMAANAIQGTIPPLARWHRELPPAHSSVSLSSTHVVTIPSDSS